MPARMPVCVPTALLLVLALLSPAASADDILMRDGRHITGVTIQAESLDRIDYTKGAGSRESVDSDAVREVRYGRTSPEFTQAIDLRDAGSLGQAAAYFMAAEEDAGLAEHIRATALVEAGDALFVNGNLPQALDAYTRFTSAYGSSRHLARALLGRGRALLYSRDFGAAKSAFELLKQEVGSKGLGPRWDLEADYFLLFTREAQGEPVSAGYATLRDRALGVSQATANRCALRMAIDHQKAGRVDDAKALYDEIIETRLEGDEEVAAAAFKGRGRISFDRGLAVIQDDAEEALAHLDAARLDLLRVYVSYKGVRREQPEALYWAGEAFYNIASLDPSEEDANTWALRLHKRCRDQFPGSEWAQKAANR